VAERMEQEIARHGEVGVGCPSAPIEPPRIGGPQCLRVRVLRHRRGPRGHVVLPQLEEDPLAAPLDCGNPRGGSHAQRHPVRGLQFAPTGRVDAREAEQGLDLSQAAHLHDLLEQPPKPIGLRGRRGPEVVVLVGRGGVTEQFPLRGQQARDIVGCAGALGTGAAGPLGGNSVEHMLRGEISQGIERPAHADYGGDRLHSRQDRQHVPVRAYEPAEPIDLGQVKGARRDAEPHVRRAQHHELERPVAGREGLQMRVPTTTAREVRRATGARGFGDVASAVARLAAERHAGSQRAACVVHYDARPGARLPLPRVQVGAVGELVEVPPVAGHDEAGGNARPPAPRSSVALFRAVGVHPLGEIRSPSPAVDQLQLVHAVERPELVARGAPQPARERRDRHPHAGERVVGGPGVRRGGPQLPHILTEDPAHLIEKPRLSDHRATDAPPGVKAAHDHAHAGEVHDRSDPRRREQLARSRLPDACRPGPVVRPHDRVRGVAEKSHSGADSTLVSLALNCRSTSSSTSRRLSGAVQVRQRSSSGRCNRPAAAPVASAS